MFKHRCPACAAVAYSAASDLSASGCPACGTDLDEAGVATRSHPSPREPRPAELIPLYGPSAGMNSSVRAVRAADGLRD
jgi:predicted  nucleic acid-binding Zn-ribbon protein